MLYSDIFEKKFYRIGSGERKAHFIAIYDARWDPISKTQYRGYTEPDRLPEYNKIDAFLKDDNSGMKEILQGVAESSVDPVPFDKKNQLDCETFMPGSQKTYLEDARDRLRNFDISGTESGRNVRIMRAILEGRKIPGVSDDQQLLSNGEYALLFSRYNSAPGKVRQQELNFMVTCLIANYYYQQAKTGQMAEQRAEYFLAAKFYADQLFQDRYSQFRKEDMFAGRNSSSPFEKLYTEEAKKKFYKEYNQAVKNAYDAATNRRASIGESVRWLKLIDTMNTVSVDDVLKYIPREKLQDFFEDPNKSVLDFKPNINELIERSDLQPEQKKGMNELVLKATKCTPEEKKNIDGWVHEQKTQLAYALFFDNSQNRGAKYSLAECAGEDYADKSFHHVLGYSDGNMTDKYITLLPEHLDNEANGVDRALFADLKDKYPENYLQIVGDPKNERYNDKDVDNNAEAKGAKPGKMYDTSFDSPVIEELAFNYLLTEDVLTDPRSSGKARQVLGMIKLLYAYDKAFRGNSVGSAAELNLTGILEQEADPKAPANTAWLKLPTRDSNEVTGAKEALLDDKNALANFLWHYNRLILTKPELQRQDLKSDKKGFQAYKKGIEDLKEKARLQAGQMISSTSSYTATALYNIIDRMFKEMESIVGK
jgi:hypothetical protein